jgi:GINS complex subunit 1
MQPPKHLLVEVRVLEDYGDIMTSSGPVILKKDEYLLLRRTDVEHLIRQGVLQETAS